MKLSIKDIVIFGLLGALMYASKVVMDVLPNIHILAPMITAITIVYRKKALYPIYVFVFITGLFGGFSTWWIPYLYIWTILWGVTMLLPKEMPKKVAPLVYMVVCSLHGFLYGTIYAPYQALAFGLDFNGMIAWIVTGLPFDIIHGISNFFCGALIVPLIKAIRLAERSTRKY